jgi:3-dehydroquinate synthase
MAEAIKYGMIRSRELFDIIASRNLKNYFEIIDDVIYRCVSIKRDIVENDEFDTGERMLLNFGHTIGHGIESSNLNKLFHGECVALGIIPMCSKEIRPRVIKVLEKCNLYNLIAFDWAEISDAIFHDKKADGKTVTVTTVSKIGEFELKTLNCDELINLAKETFKD